MIDCPSFERLVGIISSEQHAALVKEYEDVLERDSYHLFLHRFTLTLKLRKVLTAGENAAPLPCACTRHRIEDCRIVDAFQEALRRHQEQDPAGNKKPPPVAEAQAKFADAERSPEAEPVPQQLLAAEHRPEHQREVS